MPGEPFDLKKIRRNWELAGASDGDRPGGKLASVAPPLDPFVAARGDLARLRELLASDFSDHTPALSPFLRRVDGAIAGLEAVASGQAEGDARALRAELHDALFDIEDLLEVFSMLPR